MNNLLETDFSTGDRPWMGFANHIGKDTLNSKEAIEAAGLDWKVSTKSLYFETEIDNDVPAVDTKQYLQHWVPDNKVVVRESDNMPLGVVGKSYQPIQNYEAFQMMDSLVADGLMKYQVGGSLRGGKNIFLLGKIGDMSIVPEDKVDKYLLLYNSHDGSSTLRCFFTTIRVACINIVNAALKANKGVGLYVRHTGDVLAKMDQGKEILGIANTQFNQYEQFAKQLASKNMTVAQAENFVKVLFPDPPADRKRETKAHIDKRETVINLFEHGKGQDIKGVSGTAWAAYNAMTEYVNYYSTRRGNNVQERRFESAVLGVSNNLIQRGTEELIRLAA